MKKFKLGKLQKIWIKALKSGKYKQHKKSLCDGKGGYCCLGVANEILKLEERSESLLSETYDELGLYDDWGSFDDDKKYKFPRGRKLYGELTEMNDSGVTFNKIAEFIETNPELVFTKSV